MLDFRIKNGFVFDSEKGEFNQRDVCVKNGKIVDASFDCEARTEIDASDRYVLPGLIDEHGHFNLHGTMIGANADTMCIPNGVTTAVDGGSCGASNFPQFYMSNIIRYEPEVLSYLNVSTFGNKSLCIHNEDHDPADFREDLIEEMFRRYPNVLKGLKIRMCKATLGNYGIEPLKEGIKIAEHLEEKGIHCPVVIHYDDLPDNLSVKDVFDCMRPGDVVAHIYQTKGETIFDENGEIQEAVMNARKRGVLMDDCHGRVHWSFDNLEKAFKQGVFPDFISSDCVRVSEYTKPGFALPYAMSALASAGMPVEKVIQCVTINPARFLGITDKAGTLDVGTCADIAIFDIQDLKKPLSDNYGSCKENGKLFVPLLTMKSGRVAWRQIFF